MERLSLADRRSLPPEDATNFVQDLAQRGARMGLGRLAPEQADETFAGLGRLLADGEISNTRLAL